MRKTASEIEADIYALIKASKLVVASTGNTPITGTVYKEGMRPLNALTEDISISFLTGLDGQFQIGVVNVNIFVKDIDNGSGLFVKNITRIKALEIIGNTLINSLTPTDYKFSLASIIQSFPIEGINQHFVNIKLKFELKTF